MISEKHLVELQHMDWTKRMYSMGDFGRKRLAGKDSWVRARVTAPKSQSSSESAHQRRLKLTVCWCKGNSGIWIVSQAHYGAKRFSLQINLIPLTASMNEQEQMRPSQNQRFHLDGEIKRSERLNAERNEQESRWRGTWHVLVSALCDSVTTTSIKPDIYRLAVAKGPARGRAVGGPLFWRE